MLITLPVVGFTVATPVLLLNHVPPVVASDNGSGAPAQSAALPDIGVMALTVIMVVDEQLPRVYVIEAVPAETPDTNPEPATTDTLALVLLQLPPVIPSDSVIPSPGQTDDEPVIEDGDWLTNMAFVVEQPIESVYVIVLVPTSKPVTAPVPALILATPALLLLHVPPPGSVNVVVSPVQRADAPDIACGSAFTVINKLTLQPLPVAYAIEGVPAATPVTTPEEGSTTAWAVELLLHVPPDTVLFNVVVAPAQIAMLVADMEPAAGLTVTTLEAEQPRPET
jgi:hypothetical protein